MENREIYTYIPFIEHQAVLILKVAGRLDLSSRTVFLFLNQVEVEIFFTNLVGFISKKIAAENGAALTNELLQLLFGI